MLIYIGLTSLSFRSWKAATAALEAEHTAHTASSAEMRRLLIAPLKQKVAESDAQRDRLLRPVDKVIAC